MALKVGDEIRLIQPEVRGVVVDRRFLDSDADDEYEILFRWEENGQKVERWIDASKVEGVQA